MPKLKPQTLKGFRDFLPETMIIRNRVISILREVFESYGFAELQTPTLEYADILLGKYGQEAEKLMYLFYDPGKRLVGLKYDLTVPLARVIAQYPQLPKPFKRYQIQPAFRAENPQKGRYREFFQCDIDTVGSCSPLADAEILAVINQSLQALRFTDYLIRINSRAILFQILEKSAIDQFKYSSTLQSLDKLDKKPKESVEEELINKGLNRQQIKQLFENVSSAKPDLNLKEIITFAQKLGVKRLEFSPFMVRGLDYYTGAIFETNITNPKIGAVTGGGRYDKLIKNLGGPDLPAVGTSIGLERICDAIFDLKLFPDFSKTVSKYLVTIFSPETQNQSISLYQKLRQKIPGEIYLDPNDKLDKQLKYADKKGIPFVIIIGPEEIKNNQLKVKEMKTGIQKITTTDSLIEFLINK